MNEMSEQSTALLEEDALQHENAEQMAANEATSASHQSLKQHLTTPADQQAQTLRDNVEKALRNYFSHLESQTITDVYQMVLSEVEAPLLETVMEYTRGNQTKASILLGLNRGTLRKKLKQYGLI